MALFHLLADARRRIDQARTKRGRSAERDAWRDLIGSPAADPFPRRLASVLRVAKEKVGPVKEALRSVLPGGYTLAGSPRGTEPSVAEWVLALAAGLNQAITDCLPPSPSRSWMADD